MNDRTSSAIAATLIALVALGVLFFGIHWGTFAAADTDPYGYVSQADLIANGSLKIDVRFGWDMPWPAADSSFVPPGYALSDPRGFAIPRYSTGLPIVMAALQRATGRRASVFYAVPLLGAMAVVMIGWLGARLYSPWAGVVSAILMATSPMFLFQITQPVSDVPAAAWWTLSLALAVGSAPAASLGAGLAAGMAVLTRPNLFPLAALLEAFLAWHVVRASAQDRRTAINRLALFNAGLVPGFLTVAALNQYWWGSALRSGYGPLNELYIWQSVLPNLTRYPKWLVQTETPLICLALAAPLVTRKTSGAPGERTVRRDHVWLFLAFTFIVVWSYLMWGVFGPSERQYLRFLLPAFPPLIVLSVTVLFEMRRRLLSGPRFLVALPLVVAAWVGWQLYEARYQGVTSFRQLEQRYVDVGRYIAFAMPRESVFISGLHAGSIRYHGERLTVNFGRLEPGALDAAVAGLTAKGFHPYIALEQGEEPIFKERFRTHSQFAELDWPPRLQTSAGVQVHIYDPADRQHFLAGEVIGTFDMLLRSQPQLTIP